MEGEDVLIGESEGLRWILWQRKLLSLPFISSHARDERVRRLLAWPSTPLPFRALHSYRYYSEFYLTDHRNSLLSSEYSKASSIEEDNCVVCLKCRWNLSMRQRERDFYLGLSADQREKKKNIQRKSACYQPRRQDFLLTARVSPHADGSSSTQHKLTPARVLLPVPCSRDEHQEEALCFSRQPSLKHLHRRERNTKKTRHRESAG